MLLAAAMALGISAGAITATPGAAQDPLDAVARHAIKQRFDTLMELANRHDLAALHEMFWQSPTALLVAKGAGGGEGSWAGFWGNAAIDRKLHDIAASGPVVLAPERAKLSIVGLTQDVAETYVPVTITVSYAGQDGTPKPFLLIIDWIRLRQDWKIASEIILPVPPLPAVKN